MKAMVLAAGRGERMRPLTHHTPKPLLEVGGKALLAWHFDALARAGFDDVVVNASYLGQQIVDFCGDGSRWGLSIQLSVEATPLETAGGIVEALPLLGESPFLVVNGDIFIEYPLAELRDITLPASGAHLVLVPNPAHNRGGDFALREPASVTAAQVDRACGFDQTSGTSQTSGDGQTSAHGQVGDPVPGEAAWTYSGLGVYQASFFAQCERGKRPLKPLLDRAIARGVLTGEIWRGGWTDVGTPERLAALDRALISRA